MNFTALRAAAFGGCMVAALMGTRAIAEPEDTAEELSLETSDGLTVKAWYYPVEEETEPRGSVILVHDLGGSHLTVEPLAQVLQAAGYAVVAPDLRGHGETKLKASIDDQWKLLKKPDFEMMAATRGGQKRDQSGIRGDIECVRNWLKQRADEGAVVMKPLFVVGSGVGAALAATWTAADAMWPDIATGPQGREVAGLVLVSPVFTSKGFSIGPALTSDVVRHSVPLLVVAGHADRDAVRVFDQLKRQRPKLWFDNRHPHEGEKDASPASADDATMVLFALGSDNSADELASQQTGDDSLGGDAPSALITTFLEGAGTRKAR